jgi:hypothetical protein
MTILMREARSLTEITSSLTTAAIRISGYDAPGAGAAGPLGEAGAVVCARETPQRTIIRTQNQRIPFMDQPNSVSPGEHRTLHFPEGYVASANGRRRIRGRGKSIF